MGHFFWGFILRILVDRSGSCQGGPACQTGGREVATVVIESVGRLGAAGTGGELEGP